MDGEDLCALAERHGTPLHVASARTLRARCAELRAALSPYPGPVRLRFSYKTNLAAGILQVLHGAGVGAATVNGHELWLARRVGVAPEQIVFGGPNLTSGELREAVEVGAGLIVIEGFDELARLDAVTREAGHGADVALRVCPDVVPRGMNASSVAGSRSSPFGFDLRSGEATEAIRRTLACPRLRLRGAMAHIGSGIRDLASFHAAVDRLLGIQDEMRRAGATPDLLDVGGGLGTRWSRELTTFELLTYLWRGRLPLELKPAPPDLFSRYGAALRETVVDGSRRLGLPVPELVLEPGRALVSDAQVLLLRVGALRERPGLGRYAITDGGAMSVSLMFLSELHAVLLANREAPDEARRTSVFGRIPSPMDTVYRNLRLPRLAVGDLLAVMDAGAYFTSTATNFGGPRPAIVLLDSGAARLVRRRETSQDLFAVEELAAPAPSARARP